MREEDGRTSHVRCAPSCKAAQMQQLAENWRGVSPETGLTKGGSIGRGSLLPVLPSAQSAQGNVGCPERCLTGGVVWWFGRHLRDLG